MQTTAVLAPAPFFDVIRWPASGYLVHDFTTQEGQLAARQAQWGVGRYLEDRQNVYTESQYTDGGRTVHMGIDLQGPEGTPVHAFYGGKIVAVHDYAQNQDYGPTLVTHHVLPFLIHGKAELWALWGHLSRSDLDLWREGDTFRAGQVLGHMGSENENGGWPSHLHFQLSVQAPGPQGMPGVLNPRDVVEGAVVYPDPRAVLGPLY